MSHDSAAPSDFRSHSQSADSSHPQAAETRVFPSTLVTCMVVDLGDLNVKIISLVVSVIG